MLKTIASRADGIAFERPLALVLAGSTAFAILAGSGIGALTVPLALLVASLAAVGADRAIRYPPVLAKPAARRDAVEPEDAIAAEQAEPVPEHRLVRLRRADRHPDAPPRNPISAHAELGSPFMEIAAEPVRRAKPVAHSTMPVAMSAPRLDAPAAPAQADGVPDESPAISPEPLSPEPAPVATMRPAAEPIADVAPRAPVLSLVPDTASIAPARPARPSLAEMMDRLADGLDTRAAAGQGAPPRPAPPALRDALRELNRLAVRGG